MTIGCNIWMICLKLNWFVYVLRISRFFYNFLLIDATDRSKISSDQKRLFFAVSLYLLSFFANTPLKKVYTFNKIRAWERTNCFLARQGSPNQITDRACLTNRIINRDLMINPWATPSGLSFLGGLNSHWF